VARRLLKHCFTTTKEPVMSKEPKPIDLATLEAVTGGSKRGDNVLNDLSYLASSIKDLTAKTSGFSSTQMLLLCCLALQRNNGGGGFGCGGSTNVVYVQRGRWW
jgi:hypothetical protein